MTVPKCTKTNAYTSTLVIIDMMETRTTFKRTIKVQIVQKLKNNEPRPKFTGSYKKCACIKIVSIGVEQIDFLHELSDLDVAKDSTTSLRQSRKWTRNYGKGPLSSAEVPWDFPRGGWRASERAMAILEN